MTTQPRDLHAEQAVLGAALFDARAYDHASLRPEHFYDPCHGALWAEIGARRLTDRLCDATALKGWANAHAGLKELGGAAYLMRLMDAAAPLSAQVAGYGAILRDLAQRRAVIEAAQAAIATAAVTEGDAVAPLEQRLLEIAAADVEADAWAHAGDRVLSSVERAELGEAAGISTGIKGLDEATGGLKPGLWVIGGATSMGKSIIGAAIARAVASQGYGVGEHHLEMTDVQVGLRTATALAFNRDPRAQDDNAHYLSAMRGKLRPHQWAALRGAAKASVHLPIYQDTRPGRSVSQIEAASRRLIRRFQREGVTPGCILIDHEGLIAPEQGQRFPSQLERTNARSEALMAMAKRLGVCVIALSQITKEGARADGDERLPSLLDLNYGGAISQAADVVILIHRRAYYEERKPSHLRDVSKLLSREATLVVDKTRDGRRCHVTVFMDMPTAAVWEDAA